MKTNEPNTRVALEFIRKMYKDNFDEAVVVNCDKLDTEMEYDDFESLVKHLERENYLQGKNIIVSNGNGWWMGSRHAHNPFENCQIAMIDSLYVSYRCIGIKYRDVPGKDAALAREEAIHLAKSLTLKPSSIVDTGVSIQLYWKFNGYHGFVVPYFVGEEEYFIDDREFCAEIDAIWMIVNKYAYELGLPLEPIPVDINWYKGLCTVDMYAMLPGFVHRFYNRQTDSTEEFMVEIIEENDRPYSYANITEWIDEWVKVNSAVGEDVEKNRLEKYVDAFLKGKILYYKFIKDYPASWGVPYRRVGNVITLDDEATMDWVRQMKTGELEDMEDFYFLWEEDEDI
jgi:hypothetical protein